MPGAPMARSFMLCITQHQIKANNSIVTKKNTKPLNVCNFRPQFSIVVLLTRFWYVYSLFLCCVMQLLGCSSFTLDVQSKLIVTVRMFKEKKDKER